jgi:hypothetical protein
MLLAGRISDAASRPASAETRASESVRRDDGPGEGDGGGGDDDDDGTRE